ncbi:hypothetical protein F511_04721 [Dorcoceras hygrometricum]|uniref:Uncharacterized protein n=1 Tax=Dorcoceras hygrometricum TaxID=472368 RepID=A0A2Z7B103_9LAMI|nr:hypothetical protein F511_04721 [Dorcoceras hygrometricum]
MEEKQLNFNQPFLSVRRCSPIVTSEKEGRRKSNHSFSGIPRIPSHVPELKSGPVSNPGTVPFLWEQTPGRPKEERTQQLQNFVRPPAAPNLPPGRDPKASQRDSRKHFLSGSNEIPQHFQNGVLVDENGKHFESGQEKAAEERSESGDSDEAFTDALDTLSRTESFSLNCSMSGMSGFDNLDVKLKPSGSFSTDPQTREFMMGRFLPAAKAMTSEAPHYAPKKHVGQEQPQQLKKFLMQTQPSLRYGPSFTKRYSHHHGDDQEEQSDDESNYDQRPNLPSVCGLLPRFCFKNSLGRLNPLPTMSMRSRVPESPAYKMQTSSSSSGTYSETEAELNSDVSEPRPTDKIQIVELNETKSRLRYDRCQLHRRKGSAYFDAPLSLLEEKEAPRIAQETKKTGTKEIGFRKNGSKTFREFLADDESPDETDIESPVVEKTVYVDTVQKVEPLKKIPSPDMKETLDSCIQDFNKLDPRNGEEKNPPGAHEFGDCIDEYSVNEKDLDLYKTNTEDVQMVKKQATVVLENILRKNATFEDSHQCDHEFPPLPKSPSDSWLWRTLPTAPKKNISRLSHLVEDTKTRNLSLNATEGDFTMIKHQQSRCSEVR